jgi:Protein of unknown function (DUF2934)
MWQLVSRRKENRSIMSSQPEVSINPEIGPTREQIERRAYEIYLARGGQHGHDLADWIMAERELKTIAQLAATKPAGAPPDSAPRPQAALLEELASDQRN